MKRAATIFIFLLAVTLALPARALDINLINVETESPEQKRLANTYGQAYGYPPEQVAPAMLGPAAETPAILSIAQAAGTVPMTVWMMRRMGMNYGTILSSFALAPTALMGQRAAPSPYGYYPGYSGWGYINDPFLVQMGRNHFLVDILRVNPKYLPLIPAWGKGFNQALLYPYHPVHGTWMPPGIAKKYGLWVPPGQRKKIGWFPDGKGWKNDKHGGKGGEGFGGPSGKGDWDHGNKGKGKGGSPFAGDDQNSGKGKNNKDVASKGKGKGDGNGNGSDHGSKGGSGKGKGGNSNGLSGKGGGKGKGKK